MVGGVSMLHAVQRCDLVLATNSVVCKQGKVSWEFHAEKSVVLWTLKPSIVKKTSLVLHWMVGSPRC